VKCQHAPSASGQYLPVWVIPYWAEVLKIQTTSHKAWVGAEKFIQMRKKVSKKTMDGENADTIMQEAYDMLLCLPWSRDVRGFNASEPLYKLATYASCEWLATTHEDQILDLLQRELLLKGTRTEIAQMAFFWSLRQAYTCCDTGNTKRAMCLLGFEGSALHL
jgi:hypothetical protein